MSTERDDEIKGAIKGALEEHKKQQNFAISFVLAIGGAIIGYLVTHNMVTALICAVIGFFVIELFLVAVLGFAALVGYQFFADAAANQKFDANNNYRLCVFNALGDDLKFKVATGYRTVGGKFSANGSHGFDLRTRGYTRLTAANGQASFGALYSVTAADGKYSLNPTSALPLSRDSKVVVSSRGIQVEDDPKCKD